MGGMTEENEGADCGCEERGQRWFLCDYHQGYDDALSEHSHGVRPPL